MVKEMGKMSLMEAGLNSRQEALLLQPGEEDTTEGAPSSTPSDTPMKTQSSSSTSGDGSLFGNDDEDTIVSPKSGKWVTARQHLFEKLESEKDESGLLMDQGLLPVTAGGSGEDGVDEAGGDGKGDIDWTTQLVELASMGFENTTENMEALKRYNGRMARVVNFLSDQNAKRNAQLETQRNETQLQEAITATQMKEVSSSRWADQLAMLESLGFSNTDMSLHFLEKYKGSMDRVVNALSEALFDNKTDDTEMDGSITRDDESKADESVSTGS